MIGDNYSLPPVMAWPLAGYGQVGTVVLNPGTDDAQLAQLLVKLDVLIFALASLAESNRGLTDALTVGIKPWVRYNSRGSV